MCACVYSDAMRSLSALFDAALCESEVYPAKTTLIKHVEHLGCSVRKCVGLLAQDFVREARLCGIWIQTSFFTGGGVQRGFPLLVLHPLWVCLFIALNQLEFIFTHIITLKGQEGLVLEVLLSPAILAS